MNSATQTVSRLALDMFKSVLTHRGDEIGLNIIERAEAGDNNAALAVIDMIADEQDES